MGIKIVNAPEVPATPHHRKAADRAKARAAQAAVARASGAGKPIVVRLQPALLEKVKAKAIGGVSIPETIRRILEEALK